jgi:hypothetical protein
MSVGVATEQFGRTFADSLRSITACVSVVVEEETQQIQIVIADVPPQEEVVPQAAIEVLYQRTGARHLGHRLDHGSFDPMVSLAEYVLEFFSTLPIGSLPFVLSLQFTDFVYKIEFYIEAFCHLDKAIIQDTCKAQQMITVILEHYTNRTNPMRTLRLQAMQLLNNEVVEFLALLQVGAGHGEDVVIHPIGKNTDLVSQINGSSLCSACQGQSPAQPMTVGLLPGTLHFGLEVLLGVDAFVGTPLKEHNQLRQFHLSVEHIPVTRHGIAPGSPLPGTQGIASVGNGPLKIQTMAAQIQQMNAPCGFVATVFDS